MEDRKKRQARQKRYDEKRRRRTVTIRLNCEADQALTKAIRGLVLRLEKDQMVIAPKVTLAKLFAFWTQMFESTNRLMITIRVLERKRPDSTPLPDLITMMNDWNVRIGTMARLQQGEKQAMTDTIDDWLKKIDLEKDVNKQG